MGQVSENATPTYKDAGRIALRKASKLHCKPRFNVRLGDIVIACTDAEA